MARIRVPEGDGGDLLQVWALRPDMAAAVGAMTDAVYQKSRLPAREHEVARMRIAQLNECPICLAWREERYAEAGVTEELYAHVAAYRDHPEYTERERLAIEYAERFATDHLGIDDAFFERLRAHFGDDEILDLTICIAHFTAFGRLTQVLKLDQPCAVRF